MPPHEARCVACHRTIVVPDPFAADELPVRCPACGAGLQLVLGVDGGFVNREARFVAPRRARPIGPSCELVRTQLTCCGLAEPCARQPCCEA